MPERWQIELRRIDRIAPDVDRLRRPTSRPSILEPRPSFRVKLATIALALIVPAGAMYVALVMGDKAPATPAEDVLGPMANGELLYAKRIDDGWSLFAVDLDTGTERRITDGFRDYASDWSPDGTKIVFDRELENGDQGIWVANADGSDATKLIDEGRVPAWSPEGTKIAFVRPDSEIVALGDGVSATGFSLFVMDADGTDVRRLTNPGDLYWAPAWSPDGSQIAVERYGSERGIFVIDAEGSGARQISPPSMKIVGDPEWSPDGTTIAVRGASGIMLLSPSGTADVTIVPGTEISRRHYVFHPTWSPDGRWIAYIHTTPEMTEIVIQRLDGSGRRVLEIDPGDENKLEQLVWGAVPGAPA